MIDLPDLDDRTFADLTAEARALIPTLAPGWTDHNPTDPGIVLVELFAWLVEIVMYRLDRVPDRSYRTFLRLLRGPGSDGAEATSLDDALRTTLTELRERYRAITTDDFEYLALHRWKTLDAARAMGVSGVVRRARCFAEQSPTTLTQPDQRAEGHYTLVIVSAAPPDPEAARGRDVVRPIPAAPALLDGLREFFDEWRLLTTKVHVIDHAPLAVNATAKLYLRSDGVPEVVRALAVAAVDRFLDPLRGWDGTGWPFGRPIFASDVRALLDDLSGVDFVEQVEIVLADPLEPGRPPAPLDDRGQALGVALHPHEQPALGSATFQLFYRVGTKWQPT